MSERRTTPDRDVCAGEPDRAGEVHREPFVHLADLTAERALIAWGAFFFADPDGEGWRIVEDPDVHRLDGRRTARRETIGVSSPPYGHAEVIVTDAATGSEVARATTDTTNHVWVTGLRPDTEHRYRVEVEGQPWADRATYDWVETGDGPGLVRTERAYDHRFRTFPAPDVAAPVRFAVLGDYGVGVLSGNEAARRQLRLADVLDRAVTHAGVRLVLTTGDNVYLGEQDTPDGAGNEDDDWYSSFYQPYRYVIDRVPIYPGVGNHDTGESERSDNRDQLADNLFTDLRFADHVADGRAALDPGMYYRFRYGADVEFICIDTTEADDLDGYRHYFDHPRHQRWLETSFPDLAAASDDGDGPHGRGRPGWRIPFTHHPPYCAGPDHASLQPLIDLLVPLLHRSGTPLVLSGHEHNFQHHHVDGIDYVVSGAAGKLDLGAPDRCAEAGTVSWADTAHLLVVDVEPDRIVVHPVTDVTDTGELVLLQRVRVEGGGHVSGPIEITRE